MILNIGKTETCRSLLSRLACTLGVITLVLAGVACSPGADTGAVVGTEAGSSSGVQPSRLAVLASFYPLEFVVERVGGNSVGVSNLTPPGAEPHDLELGANDLVEVREADLVVYLRGISAAVDDAVNTAAGTRWFDVTALARLEKEDIHFWLDPLRLADVADSVAQRLAELDPSGAEAFRANADALRADLIALDAEFVSGLATCARRDLVTSHAAFGYLATRYGMNQESVSGLSPDGEPTAAALARVADFVRDEGVTTIYTETLLSSATARAVASETGARVAVLDPLEGLAEDAVDDYLTVMRANLGVLRTGQGCT
ncbi:MAG: metal ABC transporter substrate-binding protein [Actinomycetota bacterium]